MTELSSETDIPRSLDGRLGILEDGGREGTSGSCRRKRVTDGEKLIEEEHGV